MQMSAERSWLEPIKSFSCICANSIGTNCWLSLSGLGCKDGCTYLQGQMHVLAKTDARTCGKRWLVRAWRMQCTASEMGKTEEPILRRTALQAGTSWCVIYTEGVAPGYYLVVPSRHQSADGVVYDATTLFIGYEASHSAPLPGGQYHEKPGTPTEEVCQDRPLYDTAA